MAKGSCQSDAQDSLLVEPCCSYCPEGCGPSSAGPGVKKFPLPARQSSNYNATQEGAVSSQVERFMHHMVEN